MCDLAGVGLRVDRVAAGRDGRADVAAARAQLEPLRRALRDDADVARVRARREREAAEPGRVDVARAGADLHRRAHARQAARCRARSRCRSATLSGTESRKLARRTRAPGPGSASRCSSVPFSTVRLLLRRASEREPLDLAHLERGGAAGDLARPRRRRRSARPRGPRARDRSWSASRASAPTRPPAHPPRSAARRARP